ncbi:PREDICTED: CMRF35-like molecule 8 [Ceratotherium simum simum]|uniref:CMRF35-like molecule 8 n=1 Tax=Ceratotherium simum simum TaxID=73337 RepID=A0ABM1CZA6_CERSS|nr:PREDICTED: CMRF35-like molecule 8 [Ceratotherium simum simum]
MTQQGRAAWLPSALLLLWVPGSLSLSGPSNVTGTVGGSLSVQCRYEEKFTENKKYWCKSSCSLLWREKIVETTESEREERSGHVSIRDHPANLSFTVTMERLTKDDEGTYWCGIETSWFQGVLLDPIFQVVVSVFPGEHTHLLPLYQRQGHLKRLRSEYISVAKTSTITTSAITTSAITTSATTTLATTTPATPSATRSTSSQEKLQQTQGWGLQVLLSLLAVLLLLSAGTSLLAWRMVQRRITAGENPEPLQNPSQAADPSEPCYVNLELQMCPLREEPVQRSQEEMVYSTVAAPREDLHYTSVVFDPQSQDSEANGIPSQRSPTKEPEYSVIKKT